MSQDLFGGFPEQVQESVDGLVWLGHLETTVEFAGHEFVLRTLKGDEELYIALLAKEFIETFGQLMAMAWATIAVSLVSVDGDEHFCPPIGPNRKEHARGRFQYITQNWYWPLCEELYKEYEQLRQRQVEAIKVVSNLSMRGPESFLPSPDSLIGQDDFESHPEIMDLLDEDSST